MALIALGLFLSIIGNVLTLSFDVVEIVLDGVSLLLLVRSPGGKASSY